MRIVLLSDLHFGRARPDLVDPLLESIAREDPDLVVVAGDFVQRCWPSQWRAARAFMDRIDRPWIAVPGNHDIPLFNLIVRAVAPRAFYRHYIATDTAPTLTTKDAVIVGLDTTHRWSHQRGLIRDSQIESVAEVIRTASDDRTVVIMAHHPFHQAPEVEKKVMRNAARALDVWAGEGPHVVLSGHLHTFKVEPFLARKNRSMTLQVHCGTGLSTRLRGEPNDYAVLDVTQDAVTARRITAQDLAFMPAETYHYRTGEAGWAVQR